MLIRTAAATIAIAIATAAHAQTVHDVLVGPNGLFVFDPANIEVDLGDTVRWTWQSDFHNVVSGLPDQHDGAFHSGEPAFTGTVFEVVFDQTLLDDFPVDNNIYNYHCHPHAALGMVGSVTVVPAPPSLGLALAGAGLLARRRRRP